MEDDEDFVMLLERLFDKQDFSVRVQHSETLAGARKLLQEAEFDAVITDFRLPDCEGHEVIAELRSLGLDVPCIVVTGVLTEDDAAELMHFGAADVVLKDNVQRLVPALIREIDHRREQLHLISYGERQVRDQLRKLSAIHRAEQAVAGSTDLRLVLASILEQVTEVAPVLGASVHALDPGGIVLRRMACHWGTSNEEADETRLGEGFAGRVGLARTRIVEPLHGAPESMKSVRVGYPLTSRGRLVGVLEIERIGEGPGSGLEAQCLEALAANAAVALENDRLHTELESVNTELRLAYEAALDGWSRALDLRDHETEGHSGRVATMTVRLAEYMGESRTDLVHIRRGALLHDIGKVAVPDAILHKAGPLNEDEWTLMREHPTLAYQMLAPISFLRPALDIPYCHHERWDGAGYPRGLRGVEIPRSARIFAVVDVYDALTSDRPYRPGWAHEQAMEYIATHSGTHFDPQVVRAFSELVDAGEFPVLLVSQIVR